MLRIIGKILIGGLLTTCLLVVGLFIWASTPVKSNPNEADPAVTYLNSLVDNEPYESNYVMHNGNMLHYVEAGKGDTILFLHGFPSYWFSFSKQMEAFRNDYHVLAIDGLGTGRSDAPQSVDAYTLDNMTDNIMSLMDELDIQEFHIVGHDWGSSIAFALAKAYPEKVKSVTGISAPPVNVLLLSLETDPDVQTRFSYIEQFKRANPVILKLLGHDKRVWTNTFEPLVKAGFLTPAEGQVFRDATNNPKRINALINWYRANVPSPSDINDDNYWPEKDTRLIVPALSIWGDKDPIFMPQFSKRTMATSDNLDIIILPNVGHRPHMEQAETVNQAIRALIESKN